MLSECCPSAGVLIAIGTPRQGGARRGTSVGDIRLNGAGELQMLNGEKLFCTIHLDSGNLFILYRLF